MIFKAIIYGIALAVTLSQSGKLPDRQRYSDSYMVGYNMKEEGAVRKVDIDKFYMDTNDAEVKIMFGGLEVYDLLTRCVGDPLNPVRRGAVLTRLNMVSYAILAPETSTEPASLQGRQYVCYIVSGTGKLTVSDESADVVNGIGLLIPPDLEFSLSNTGSSPLVMYIIDEPVDADFTPRQKVIVKNEYDNPISSNYQRTSAPYWLFNPSDGLSVLTAVNTMMFEPRSAVPPHVHEKGVEEIWIGIEGDMYFQIGLQRRRLAPGIAYKAPADGRIPHTNINVDSSSRKVMWLMVVPQINGRQDGSVPDDT